MDLSQFTTAELQAMQRGDFSGIPTDKLRSLHQALGGEPQAQEPAPDQNKSGLADLLTAFQQGTVSSTKTLTDVAGAGNAASSYLGGVSENLSKEYSPAAQAEMQRQAERMKAAEESGSTWEELKAGAKNVAEAPLRTAAQALGSFVPYIPALLAGPVAGALGIGARGAALISAATPRIMAAIGTAQGAGAAKGAIYEAVQQAAIEDGMSPEEAAKKADIAQEYFGANTDAILAGASLGYLASRSGAEKMLKDAAAKVAQKGAVREIGKEIVTEGAQGGQERLAANIALQREGKETPTFQGVAGQAVQEGLAGGLGAGAVSLGGRAEPAVAKPQDTTRAEPAVPDTAEPGTQGQLFPKEEMTGFKTPKTEVPPQTEPEAKARMRQTQQGLGLDQVRQYEDIVLERERLSQGEQTPEVQARIAELDKLAIDNLKRDIEAKRAEGRADTAARRKAPAIAKAEPDLFGMVYPEADTTVEPAPETTPEAKTNEGLQPGAPGWQYSLGMRGGKAEPTFSMQDIEDLGIPLSTTRNWFNANVAGKTRAGIQQMVDADPTLVEGKGIRAKVMRQLLAPEPAAFKEPKRVQPKPATVSDTQPEAGRATEPTPEPTTVSEPGQPEPGVGVSAVPQGPAAGGPTDDTGATTDTGAGSTEPAGVESTSTVSEQPVGGATGEPAPLGQMTLPGMEPGGEMAVQPPAPEQKLEFESLRDAIAAGVPTYQMSLGEPAPKERDTGAKVDPASPVLRRLENAQSLPQLEAAMDDLVRTLQNPTALPATSRRALQDFVENGLRNIPNFEAALSQAEARVRKAPAAPQKIDEAKPTIEQRREDKQREAQFKAEEAERKLQEKAVKDLEEKLRKEELRQAEAKSKKAEADARAAEAKAKEAEAKVKKAEAKEAEDTRTLAQRRNDFKKGVGSTNLQGRRDNTALGKAMAAGDTGAVLDALSTSKNPVVQKVAEDAKKLKGLQYEIDDNAAETQDVEIDSQSRALTIKSASNFVTLLDALRSAVADSKFSKLSDSDRMLGGALDSEIEVYKNQALVGLQDEKSIVRLDVAMADNRLSPLLHQTMPKVGLMPTAGEVRAYLAALEAEASSVDLDVIRSNAQLSPNTVAMGAIAGLYNPRTNTVSVAERYAKDEHVLGHETAHAVVFDKITNPTAKDADTVRRLTDLYMYVKKQIAGDLNKFGYGVEPYGTSSLQEFVAEGLSNPKFQFALSEIKYQNTNAWDRFVQRIAELLGLKRDSALTELLGLYNTLAVEPTTASPDTQARPLQARVDTSPNYNINDLTAPLPGDEKKSVGALIRGFQAGNKDVSFGEKLRVRFIDSAASIERRLADQFDGAIGNAMGKVNPMGLFRQAQDYTKMLQSFFTKGGLRKDAATNLWQVVDQKGVRPPMEVFKIIDKYAEQQGISRKEATNAASRILEGVRLDEMRKANKAGADFVIHLSDAEIDRRVKIYNSDATLREMSAAMDEARVALVQHMVDVGRLTAEQGKEWAAVSNYVPFDRINEDTFAKVFSGAKRVSMRGLSQLGKLPELTGTKKYEVGNVFENYLNTMGWMLGQVIKSDANLQTLRALEDAGIAHGPRNTPRNMANPVRAYIDGEEKFWDLPSKYDVVAFKDLNPAMPWYISSLAKFSNVLRKTVTSLPPFALKQVTDDIQRAIMTSGVTNPWALTRGTLANFAKYSAYEIAGIRHPDVDEMGAWGLTGEYDFVNSRPAASILKDEGYMKRTKFGTLFHRLEGITRASDLAVRKAIYDQTLRESQGDQALALTRAREFINFRRRGSDAFTGAMVATIPFFNAYIQGMDVLYRAATGKRSSTGLDARTARRMFMTRALIATGISTLYAMGKDDDDEQYKTMNLQKRDANWVIGGYTLPVPGELGAIFKVIPERVIEYYKRYGTEDEQEAMEAVRTAMTFAWSQYGGRTVPIPQAVKPVLEAMTNHSFFTGRELEGTYLQGTDPSRRRGANQSELGIAIADFARESTGVEISPIIIDNFLRGYFGSVATHVMATTDGILNPDRVDRPIHKMALLSTYIPDPVGNRMLGEFYDMRSEIISVKQTMDDIAKRDINEAAAYADKHADKLTFVSAVNATLRQIADLRNYRKYLNGPDGAAEMSKEEREAELEELRRYELELVDWTREAKREMAIIRKEMNL